MKKIVETFKKLGLDKDALAQLEEAFNERVEAMTGERLEIEIAEALKNQATEHTVVLNQIYEGAATLSENKLKEQADTHLSALKRLIEKHEKIVNNRATEHRDELVEDVSSFLDEQLVKLIPEDTLQLAAENNIARKLLGKVKDVCGLDEEFVSSNVRSALVEGKQLVETQTQEIQNWKIRALKAEASAVLAEKCSGMPSAKVAHIKEHFQNKSPAFIKRNFGLVLEMFDSSEKKDRRATQSRTRKRTATRNVDRVITEDANDEAQRTPRQKTSRVIKEDVNNNSADDPFGYIEELSKF